MVRKTLRRHDKKLFLRELTCTQKEIHCACTDMDTFNKTIREFRRFLKQYQLHLRCYSRTGGGHYRLTIASPTGRTLVYIMASTSSDSRAKANRERDILRYFTEGQKHEPNDNRAA